VADAEIRFDRHDLLPHFTVTTIEGRRVAYSTFWQRKNLLLVSLPSVGGPLDEYAEAVSARAPEWDDHETACVITRDHVPGVPTPSVLIADRWREIYLVSTFDSSASAPSIADLLESVAHVHMRCPECEGEAR
jgi:hypothetical protein